MIHVETQVDGDWPQDDWPTVAERAVDAAMRASPRSAWIDAPGAIEVSVRFAGDAEVARLNAAWRGKDAPTNVLSFPMIEPGKIETIVGSDSAEVLLGDIVLAHGVCAREADERGLSIESHASHLIVHGTFHLLGLEHEDDAEAEAMEAFERAALAAIGIADPYAAPRDTHGV